MSVHLVGGGWSEQGDPEVTGPFLSEATAHAVAAGRELPRLRLIIVLDDDVPSVAYREGYPRSFTRVAPAEVLVTIVEQGGEVPAEVVAGFAGLDGLVIGGGLTPAYLRAIGPLGPAIRSLVAAGLPYLGFSAGAMIAPERALIGGWRVGGVAVCPEEAGEDLDAVTIVDGLGLVARTIDVHTAQWGTLGRLVAAAEAGLVEGGIAIDETTVVIADADALRVAGSGRAWSITRAGGMVGLERMQS